MQIPKNVIQTGETDPTHKIYIEDYVHTLFRQYWEKEADFSLYGRKETEGELSYYFLYGAAVEEAGWEIMENRYFPGRKRIGEATFSGKEKWLFFEDGYAVPLDGYFIFYEQNEDMQSYLIAMHQNRPGEKTVQVHPRAAGGTKERALYGAEGTASELDGTAGEPRRIRRRPVVYDLRREDEEEKEGFAGEKEDVIRKREERKGEAPRKTLHAADLEPGRARREKLSHASGRNRQTPGFSGRMAGAAALLILCAIGVVTLGGYRDMEQVGNFFAQTARQLEGQEEEEAALIVEEKQLGEGPAGEVAAGEEAVGEEPAGEELAGEEAGGEEPAKEASLPVLSGSADPLTGEAVSEISGPEEGTFQALVPETEMAESSGGQETTLQAQGGFQTEAAQTEGGTQAEAADEAADEAEEAASEGGTGSEDGAASEGGTASDGEEEAADASPVTMTSYVVKEGDSLAAICRRQYGNLDRMDEIVALNGIEDPNRLIAGQKIILPN